MALTRVRDLRLALRDADITSRVRHPRTVLSRMPVDIHAHYVPPQLIDAVAARGKDIGVRLIRADGRRRRCISTMASRFGRSFRA